MKYVLPVCQLKSELSVIFTFEFTG